MVWKAESLQCSAAVLLVSSIAVISQNTTAPSASPSYGPASATVVESIIFSTLASIIAILFFYFTFGYYSYLTDVKGRMKKHDDRNNDDIDNPLDVKLMQSERSPLLDDLCEL